MVVKSGGWFQFPMNKYVQPAAFLIMDLNKGSTGGCAQLPFPPGKYEEKIFLGNTLAAVLPFEIK